MKQSLLYSLFILSAGAAAQDNVSPVVQNPAQLQDEEVEHIEVKKHYQPYRGNVPLIDTPQAVDSINATLLENQGITRFIDALDFSPAIVR